MISCLKHMHVPHHCKLQCSRLSLRELPDAGSGDNPSQPKIHIGQALAVDDRWSASSMCCWHCTQLMVVADASHGPSNAAKVKPWPASN